MQNLTKYFKLCSVLIGLAAIVILLRPDSLVKAGYVFNPFTKKLDYVNDIVPGGVVGTSTANYVAFYLNATTVTGTPFLTIGSTGIIFTTASGTSITSTNAFFSSLAFTDAVGTNLTLSNLTSTNASFANGKITIDDAASAVFVLANEQAMGATFDTGLVSDFYSVNAGPGGQTQYIGAYWSPDMTTTGIMTIYRYGRGHDSGNAMIIDGAANTMEIPLDTTFLSGLNFVNATGTSITTTNAFATNLGTTNFSATNGSFTNLTSTNLFATSSNLIGLTFTNASGTTLTSTNSYFNNVYINTTTQLGTVSLQGVPSLDLVKVVSSSGAQIFAIKPNGQVVIGPNSLSQTGHQTLEHPTTNDYALTFTNGVHYTAMLGRQPGTSGQMAIGGLGGTTLNLWAGGISRVVILNTNGFVGVNSSTPSTRFVVVGTSTFDGAILQTNFGDCDASTQNVTYDLTTGQFGCGTDDNNEQRVGTSTANYFAFYSGATAVTGTPWVKFASGTLSITTSTEFSAITTFIDEVTFNSSIFGTSLTLDNTLTTQNLGVNVSSIFDGDASFIGNTVQFFGGISSTAITTTNLYIAGMLKDWTGSPGNSGDIYISTGTSTIWKDSAGCDPITTECTLMDYTSYFIVTGATGCPEGYVLYKDDSTYTCSPDVQWMYYLDPKVFSVNGTISSTDLVAQGTITTTNLVVLGSFSVDDLSVNNLTAITSTLQNVYVSTTLVLYSATGTAAQMFIYGLPDNQTIASLNDVNDPGLLQIGTALANHMAIYSDDITRILEFASSSGGSVSLRNENLSPNNTGASAIYDMSGVLQTITVTSLFGNGYIFRGCITSEGYHYCMAASSTGTYIKRVTSSPSVSIATPSNWSTSTISGFTLNASMPGIVGVNYLGQIMILSSTTYFQPMAVTKSSNTLTATGGNTLASAACNLVTCRVNYTGFWARNSSAPYMTHYDNNGTIINTYQRGQSDPSLTGPTVFVTKYSLYLFLVDALFKQRI